MAAADGRTFERIDPLTDRPGKPIPVDAGDFSLIDRKVVDVLIPGTLPRLRLLLNRRRIRSR